MSLQIIFSYNGILTPIFYWVIFLALIVAGSLILRRPRILNSPALVVGVLLWICHFILIWGAADQVIMWRTLMSIELPHDTANKHFYIIVETAIACICWASALLSILTLTSIARFIKRANDVKSS